jgi:hypothetical protein
MTSATLARRLSARIDKLEDRIHNDYETLLASILKLDADVKRLEVELARATHGRLLAQKPARTHRAKNSPIGPRQLRGRVCLTV